MLNFILAFAAVSLWLLSYGLYFARDLRRWWRLRPQRRAEAERERARRIEAYAAWVRDIPPPRSRLPVMPTPLPEPRTGVIVAFPRGKRRVRR